MDELKNKKILLVDDERELLKMTEEALRSEGFFNIYTAENCKAALETIKNQPIAIMLLDVMLPDGDGFSLFEQIRKKSQAPAIFLTAKEFILLKKLYEKNKPSDIPEHYSINDIAKMTRWFLNDYPVYVHTKDYGLLVLGIPKNAVGKYDMA